MSQIVIPDEQVTSEDVVSAEATGKAPIGRYHCTVTNIEPDELTYMTPMCIGLKVELKINYAIEINKKPAEGTDVLLHKGKKITDDIGLFAEGEKDYARNRRIQIAKRFGLISDSGGAITGNMWMSLIGKNILVNYVQRRAKNKETGKYEPTDFNCVSMFDGYETVPGNGSLESASAAIATTATPTHAPAKEIDPEDI